MWQAALLSELISNVTHVWGHQPPWAQMETCWCLLWARGARTPNMSVLSRLWTAAGSVPGRTPSPLTHTTFRSHLPVVPISIHEVSARVTTRITAVKCSGLVLRSVRCLLRQRTASAVPRSRLASPPPLRAVKPPVPPPLSSVRWRSFRRPGELI